jgi:hypothetical protein
MNELFIFTLYLIKDFVIYLAGHAGMRWNHIKFELVGMWRIAVGYDSRASRISGVSLAP